MTCLSIVRTACGRLGLNRPTAVISSTDPQTIQLLELLNEEGQTLAETTNWNALTNQATFTTVATEIQGSLATIAPGLKFIVNDTIWNLDLRFPVFGPLSPQNWAQQTAVFYQGPWNQFRIIDNEIHFVPSPVAGQQCRFEYISSNWTASGAEEFQTDADTSLLDEKVMVMGLIWRFRQAKGLDFSADLEKYSRRVADMVARESPKAVLSLGPVEYDDNAIITVSGIIGGINGQVGGYIIQQ
jgi:hypothetical protein